MILLNLLAVSIGIGLLVTLLLVEVFGLAAGGLVVPGYFALKLLQPWNMAITLLASYLTFITVRALASFMVVYGRRRTALMILFGYLFGSLIDLSIGGVMSFPVASELGDGSTQFRYFELGVIGYIIPGLIAIWFERQGVVKTLVGLIVSAVLVRLILIIAVPDMLMAYEAQEALNRADFTEALQELLR
ncbi:MAG TPA: poly-gamma-glutamate biosynthesis protein PgsC [Wenzhouxiangella sp.]|nr:poly-gamma-glutamate biosynthesis protein PgsC [Wenzhouxiangella sp.]HLS06226.1 poly-gamma-glutamate biosynthesis protein PgsC [Wenzhouxiangella sp.]